MFLPPLTQYRTTCPICGELSGVPWSVVTSSRYTVTVNLRCPCGHDWSATRVTDQFSSEEGPSAKFIMLEQKADRHIPSNRK